MAEAKTLEDAYERYQNNQFSRKDLFGFLIDRLKAAEANVERLEGEVRHLVSALVRGVQESPLPQQVVDALPDEIDAAMASAPRLGMTRSERMKESWRKRKEAQAVADGVSANG